MYPFINKARQKKKKRKLSVISSVSDAALGPRSQRWYDKPETTLIILSTQTNNRWKKKTYWSGSFSPLTWSGLKMYINARQSSSVMKKVQNTNKRVFKANGYLKEEVANKSHFTRYSTLLDSSLRSLLNNLSIHHLKKYIFYNSI